MRKTLIMWALIFASAVSAQAQEMKKGEMTKFTVRIENISSPDGMKASDDAKRPFAMSPGLCIVHTNNAPVFSSGKKDRGKALEVQAEDGNPTTLAKSLEGDKGVKSIEVFNTPNGVVKNIKDVKDGFTYPKTANVMRVSTVS